MSFWIDYEKREAGRIPIGRLMHTGIDGRELRAVVTIDILFLARDGVTSARLYCRENVRQNVAFASSSLSDLG